MQSVEQRVKEIENCSPTEFTEQIQQAEHPLLLRGLVADWPLVQAAKQSADAADRYLRRFYNGTPVTVSNGSPDIHGRIFYNDDLTAFNFDMQRSGLYEFLDTLKRYSDETEPPVHYVGSTTVDYILPGLRDANDLDFGPIEPLASIWLGNQSRIAAHYDIPDNLACVVAGKRRFTLFPPGQLENLYIGPLDFTPAGQAISLVDMQQPDFDRYPKFRQALKYAQLAEMVPGDAIYIPSMWWHHVESLESFNGLINYWWRNSPAYMGTPMDVLNHALLSIRDLPVAQRQAWKAIFEHYVFEPDADVTAHIPCDRRGVLAPMDDLSARKLRALLLKQLNR